jgi:hypothetical protein
MLGFGIRDMGGGSGGRVLSYGKSFRKYGFSKDSLASCDEVFGRKR